MKTHKFIDSTILYAQAGNGGNGIASFRREKFVPRGGPDGGDGGRGGHVILQGDSNHNSLIHIFFAPQQRAKDAGHGKGQCQYGRNGSDCVVKVPLGTVILREDTRERVGEILEHDQQIIVAQGGKGGRGNVHWKSATHQVPMECTPGIPGEVIALRLELKLLADIGLVGFPNAGKSSLLRCISQAHPKVAAYPFTTLSPVIGTVQLPDFKTLTVADIPGIIDGAHEGIGLGLAFLRHIERAPALLFVVDISGADGRKPHEDFFCLRKEITLYGKGLEKRPYRVVANKMDLDDADEALHTFSEYTGETSVPVSALTGEGIPALKEIISQLARPQAD